MTMRQVVIQRVKELAAGEYKNSSYPRICIARDLKQDLLDIDVPLEDHQLFVHVYYPDWIEPVDRGPKPRKFGSAIDALSARVRFLETEVTELVSKKYLDTAALRMLKISAFKEAIRELENA